MAFVNNRIAGQAAPTLANPGGFNNSGALQSGKPMPLTPAPQLTNFSPQALLQNYNQAFGQSQNANEQMYNNILGGYGNLSNQVGGQYQNLGNQLQGAYGQNANSILGGYQNLTDKAMADIAGVGTQQTKDINTAYNAAGATQQANLAGQGLGGTTIAPTMAAGNEAQKQQALGQLNQALLQQKIGTETGLGQAQLGAQQGLNAGQTALGQQLGEAGIGAQAGIGQNQLNFQERINQPYPDQNAFYNAMMGLGKAGYGLPGAGGGPSFGGGGGVSYGYQGTPGAWPVGQAQANYGASGTDVATHGLSWAPNQITGQTYNNPNSPFNARSRRAS